MFQHYLKIAWRNLQKDKIYSAVNITGLAIAVACSFLLVFWIRFEVSYEKDYPDADKIYKVLEEETRTEGINYKDWVRPGFAKKIKDAFPQVKYSCFMSKESLPFKIVGSSDDSDGIVADLVGTNEDFLRMFAYEYVEGSPEAVMKNKGAIMSEETARKFFGNKSAIGEMVSFGKSGRATFIIEAVVKVPENTHIKFGILNPYANNEAYGGVHYIRLTDEYKITPEFEEQVAKFLSTTRDTKNRLKLQALRDVHLHSPKEIANNSSYGNIAQIWLFSGAVLLILLVAVINYVNTSIARSMSRVKEVGVRKVFGANRRRLIERFLLEAFVVSFVAVFIALVLVELLFPSFSQLMGNRIELNFDFGTLLIALATCIVVSLLSGGYSAFYLSSFSPMMIMKGGAKTGSKEGLRKLLIGVQFFLSISVLLCAVFIYKQINAIYNAETGVDRKNVIILNTMLWHAESFIQVIKKENPNVIDASMAGSAPYNSSYNYSGVSWTGGKESSMEMEFTQIFCDHNYANTFGLEMVQGEFIPPGLPWWQWAEDKSFNIVINEAFKKLIGEENPLGITVNYAWGFQGKIIGVVKDFNFKPLKEPIKPLIISFNPEITNKLYIKTTGKDQRATIDYIISKYKEMRPDRNGLPVTYRTVEDEYDEMYENELRAAGMLSVFSVISLLLAIMGIVSMISFMVEKRTKEIAIRRINGARVWDIIKLFAGDIMLVAVIATALAIPLCYILMSNWLETYIYRTTLSWWIFLAIPLLIILATLLVISLQIFFTARKNPVDSLRSD